MYACLYCDYMYTSRLMYLYVYICVCMNVDYVHAHCA